MIKKVGGNQPPTIREKEIDYPFVADFATFLIRRKAANAKLIMSPAPTKIAPLEVIKPVKPFVNQLTYSEISTVGKVGKEVSNTGNKNITKTTFLFLFIKTAPQINF